MTKTKLNLKHICTLAVILAIGAASLFGLFTTNNFLAPSAGAATVTITFDSLGGSNGIQTVSFPVNYEEGICLNFTQINSVSPGTRGTDYFLGWTYNGYIVYDWWIGDGTLYAKWVSSEHYGTSTAKMSGENISLNLKPDEGVLFYKISLFGNFLVDGQIKRISQYYGVYDYFIYDNSGINMGIPIPSQDFNIKIPKSFSSINASLISESSYYVINNQLSPAATYYNVSLIECEKYTIQVFFSKGLESDLDGNDNLFVLSSYAITNFEYVFTAPTYQVNFNTNGGESVASLDLDENTILTSNEIPTPTREGYQFAGWFLDSALDTPLGLPYTLASDITLYASWRYILPTPPHYDGYTFDGWYLDEAFIIPYVSQNLTEDTSLYAKYTPITYNIIYNLNGGSLSGQPLTYNVETNTITLLAPSRTGYTFIGWWDNTGFNGSPVTQIIKGSLGNKEFFAKWQINRHSVTFNSNNGSAVEGIIVDYGTVITAPETTREGYEFKGWFADSQLTQAFNFDLNITSDITLYAKWDITKIVISLYVRGELFATVTVDYNTPLIEVIEEFQSSEMRLLNIIDDMDLFTLLNTDSSVNVELKEGTFSKLGGNIDYFLENYWEWLLGCTIAIVIVAVLFTFKRRNGRIRRR